MSIGENMDITTDMIPDDNEKKSLRKYYFKLSLIMIALICLFNLVNNLMMYICSGLIAGGFDKASIEQGQEVFYADKYLTAMRSYLFCIIGDIAAVVVGIAITHTDLKSKLTFKGFDVKDFVKFNALSFGIGIPATFLTLVIAGIVALIMGKGDEYSQLDTSILKSFASDNPLWLDILVYSYVCVIGPILEELVFRGVLLEGLRKYGNKFGIIMSAVMFGLFHQRFEQCIPAIAIGLVFAFMAVRSGSLIPSILVHILNNSMSAVLMIMMSNMDTSVLEKMDVAKLSEMSQMLEQYSSMFAVMMVIGFFRIACLIGAVAIAIGFFGQRRKLIENSEYSDKRTWSYLFTSVPWLLVIGFLLVRTFMRM